MYELTVERTFSAAHAIMMGGQRESVHGHDWRVTVNVAGESLDDDGLLCDFHALEAAVDAAIAPFNNRHLNEMPPFDRVNPTAEHVAKHIATAILPTLPPGVSLCSVSVTEAPGCIATYRP
jgi:6-pyruvoyltetrahydropterin/6-carboxytetrahydropterin synthase